MNRFTGTYLNRLDAKGRVSIPAPFRMALRTGNDDESPVTLFVGPSRKYACIDGWPKARMDAIALRLEEMDPFSDEYDDLAMSTYGNMFEIEADKEGRIVLSDTLRAKAQIDSHAAFIGMGGWFQIWNNETGQSRLDDATAAARVRDRAKAAKAAA